jgi:Mg-chelatase subunit ChlD
MNLLTRRQLLTFGLLLLLVAGLPTALFLTQKKQEIRSKASGSLSASLCKNTPADIMLVIDHSSSMGNENDPLTGNTKLHDALQSANGFVDDISQGNTSSRIGVVTFSSYNEPQYTYLVHSLTNDFSSLKSEISAIPNGKGTCMQCGIDLANTEIKSHGKSGNKKVIIILSDGDTKQIEGSGVDQIPLAEKESISSAKTGYDQSGTVFFAIGYGKDVNTDFLQQIGEVNPGGYYFSAPNSSELPDIYNQIIEKICVPLSPTPCPTLGSVKNVNIHCPDCSLSSTP